MPVMNGSDGRVVEYEDLEFTTATYERLAPVVLIHGLGCTWRVWNPQILPLAENRRVILVNARGSGASKLGGRRFSISDMAADIHELLTYLSVEGVVMIGLSMGGAIALEYALDFPDTLSGLIIVGSAAGVPDPMGAVLDAQQEFIEAHDIDEIAESRMAVALGPDADSGLRRWMVEMITANDVHDYRSQAAAVFSFDVRDRLGGLSVPTVIIHGDEDRVLPVALARDLCTRMPGSRLYELEGLGHFANLEDPTRFNAALLCGMRALGDVSVPRGCSFGTCLGEPTP